jgi:hypothetical protein
MVNKGFLLMVFLLECALVCGQSHGMTASEQAMIRSKMALEKMSGRVPLHFSNAVDGKSIVGLSVYLQDAGNFTTDRNGIAVLPKLRDGTYTITVSKQGFITTPIQFSVQIGVVAFDWFSVSPGMEDKDFRVVLDWGEHPRDLDLHFVKEGAGGYHISYHNMVAADDGTAVLDCDDTDSFGPETITVEKAETDKSYTVYVHDYTNRKAASSNALSKSGAAIRVYSQNRLLYTFPVPKDTIGTRWDIFKIENGEIVPINTVQ